MLDVGPGMGYFTLPLARIVGPTGKVIAVDLQKHMLDAIQKRARKAGLQDRIMLQLCEPDEIGVTELVDFCLAFWMVHEVQNRWRFFSQITAVLKPGGELLVVEPKLHVSQVNFNATLDLAKENGFEVTGAPRIFLSNAAVLRKNTH